MTYRNMKWVYQTPIRVGYKDALDVAVREAIERASKWHTLPYIGWAFRVDDASYSVAIDPDADYYGVSTQLEIVAFPILKRTDNGFRIRLGGWDGAPETTWISFAWTKQWASLTPEGALRDFVARRNKQAKIYESRANKARHLAAQAERVLAAACPPLTSNGEDK